MNVKSKWLLAGALALGVSAAIPSSTEAQNRNRDRNRDAAQDDRESDQIRYAQLPADVKKTVDQERKNHELKRITRVKDASGQDFFRVIIDEKGTDKVIRVAPDGRLLSEQDVADRNRPAANRDRPAADRGDRAADRGGADDGSRQVRYNALPGPVKETLDKQRGRREVKRIDDVRRGEGQDFFRAIIDAKGSDKVVRIAPDGRLLSSQQARDENVKREIRVGRGERNAEHVDFDRLPGPVKTEIGRLAKSDEVQDVVVLENARGQKIYRAEVGEGKYTRFIRVGEDGRALGVRGDVEEGEVVRFDRTPGEVKTKIGQLAKSGQVEEVIKYERGNRTYYQAEVEDQQGRKYFYTVDENGREVEDLPRVDAR
jgi:hypothetical protein